MLCSLFGGDGGNRSFASFGCFATLRILSPSRVARHGPGFDYRLADFYRKNIRMTKVIRIFLVETAEAEATLGSSVATQPFAF